jgi:FMN-dependent NADH-azoreductase
MCLHNKKIEKLRSKSEFFFWAVLKLSDISRQLLATNARIIEIPIYKFQIPMYTKNYCWAGSGELEDGSGKIFEIN